MFNRLPPELVRQIIESAIPLPLYPLYGTYKAHKSNLQAFCLVCKYLRLVAQPLLFEFVMATNSPRTINQALIAAKSKGWTRCIREVLIRRYGSLGSIPSRFERLAKNGRGLRVLTFVDLVEPLDVSLLRNIPQLQQVRFFGKSFKISSRFVLPRLESLTIGHTSACALLPMLSPAVLPALRNLALPFTHEGNFKELRRSRIADLSGQLDATFLPAPEPDPYRTYDPTDYFPAAYFPRTLFDVQSISQFGFTSQRSPLPTFPRRRSTVHHLRIRASASAANLELLVVKIEQDGPDVKSIYLSPEWHHHASPLFLEKLTKICQESLIDLIYEKQDGWFPSCISEEFCRRQRELRGLESA